MIKTATENQNADENKRLLRREREEFFPCYQEARATFELWTKEAREFNNSDDDGVFFWDTSLCRMVAEYTGHNGDGGSLVEFGV